MKKTFITSALLVLLSFLLISQENKGPVLTYEKPVHDYGKVYTDDLPETRLPIVFKNTGNAPLVLTNVRACCGTRVTYWPKEPVMPGLTDTIRVEFRLMPRPHMIRRTVIASSNCSKNSNSLFRMTGEVIQRED